MACAIHFLESLQFFSNKYFTEEVVFFLSITCKTIFMLSLKTFLKLSLGIKIELFEKGTIMFLY